MTSLHAIVSITTIIACLATLTTCMPKPEDLDRKTRAAPKRIGLAEAAKYLGQYGYISHNSASRTIATITDLAPSALAAPIRRFQKFAGLQETGTLDGETMRYMSMSRCGVDDTVGTFSMRSKGEGKLCRKTRDSRSAGLGCLYREWYDARGRYEDKRRKGKRKNKNKGKKHRNRNKGEKARSRQKRYDLQGSSWRSKQLKYTILNYTPDMRRADVNKDIKRAFQYWANASSLTFQYTSNASKADIRISFGQAQHGDAYPFDGEGGTLAHAFFPESGEAHFDDAELFSHKGQGKNLLIVAAHEFGHSLGLGHSTVPDSLMAPFYQGYVENFKLHQDDIAAIQKLYGKNVNRRLKRPTAPVARPTKASRTTRPTQKPRVDEPDVCSTDIDDVISYSNSRERRGVTTYAFKGKYYYKIDDYGVVAGYPKKITQRWKKLRGNIHAAAHSSRTGRTYFFQGKQVHVYHGTRYLTGLSAQCSRLLPDHPKTALSYGGDGMIHIFKKKNVYIFDDYRMRVSKAKHISSGWKGVPEDLDAAFTWERNGKTYLIKGSNYYKFDDRSRRVAKGYPRNFNQQWFGCTRRDSTAKSLRELGKSKPQKKRKN